MGELSGVRREFSDLWGRLGPFWGISRPAARVYAALVARPDGLDAEALSEELELSRGGVSTACRELTDWGLVLQDRAPGGRRVVYRAEVDPQRVVTAIVRARKRREWDPILEHVRDWRGRLRGERSHEARALEERLALIEGIVDTVDGMADSFLKGGVVSRLGLEALVAAARRRRKKR